MARYRRRIYPSRRRGYYRVAGRSTGALVVTERKYFDVARNAVNVAPVVNWSSCEYDPLTPGTLFCPVQSSKINGRVGRKCRVNKIIVRGSFEFSQLVNVSTLGDGHCGARVMLVLDKQTNGTQLNSEDVIEGNLGNTMQSALYNPMSLANLGRFQILHEKYLYPKQIYAVQHTSAGATIMASASHCPFKLKYKFKNPMFVHFNASNGGAGDGDVGDIVDHSFHLLCNAFGFNTLNPAGTIAYSARTYYTDA